MTAITLEAIKAEQRRIAEMIDSFEAQAKTRLITLPQIEIELKDGEHYAGIVVGKEGEASYHLILLPDETEPLDWGTAALEWAGRVRGPASNAP